MFQHFYWISQTDFDIHTFKDIKPAEPKYIETKYRTEELTARVYCLCTDIRQPLLRRAGRFVSLQTQRRSSDMADGSSSGQLTIICTVAGGAGKGLDRPHHKKAANCDIFMSFSRCLRGVLYKTIWCSAWWRTHKLRIMLEFHWFNFIMNVWMINCVHFAGWSL